MAIHTAVAEYEDPWRAVKQRLLTYRDTSHPATGMAPTIMMFRRFLKINIPMLSKVKKR